MARFVVGGDRSQSTLFPECLEDYLAEDNPVRAIDVLVDELDLGEVCFSVDAEQDDAETEPDLGSVGDMHLNQERWAVGDRRDLEQDDAESGIADQDGLDEQVPFRDWQGVGMV